MATSKKYHVIGIGNAVTDIIFQVKDSAITDFNLRKGAIVFPDADAMTKSLSFLTAAYEPQLAPGGSAANTMAGIANMLCEGNVAFCGVVGNDADGEFYIRETQNSGVQPLITVLEGKTAQVLSLVTDDGERTFMGSMGVCPNLAAKHVPMADIGKSQFLHLEGYGLYDPRTRAVNMLAMQHAKACGTRISLDLSFLPMKRKQRRSPAKKTQSKRST